MRAFKEGFIFPKKEKLKSQKVFDSLFDEGRTLKAHPVQLRYLPFDFEDGEQIKVAVVAPKRKFKKAFQRNRVKRLLREAYRLNKSIVFNNIEGSFALLFLYIGNSMPSPVDVEQAVQQLLQDFVKKQLHEKNS